MLATVVLRRRRQVLRLVLALRHDRLGVLHLPGHLLLLVNGLLHAVHHGHCLQHLLLHPRGAVDTAPQLAALLLRDSAGVALPLHRLLHGLQRLLQLLRRLHNLLRELVCLLALTEQRKLELRLLVRQLVARLLQRADLGLHVRLLHVELLDFARMPCQLLLQLVHLRLLLRPLCLEALELICHLQIDRLQALALLQRRLDLLLQLRVRHQLLLAELGKVDDRAEVAPRPRGVRLVQVLEAEVLHTRGGHEAGEVVQQAHGGDALVVQLRELQRVDGREHGLQQLLARHLHQHVHHALVHRAHGVVRGLGQLRLLQRQVELRQA
mmetsp:Transcript_16572/g.42484  ORF Transcript_16572/g.42484 Transcript_16572/m.42484 type:complete len:324 (+) Transcript_16572:421-1392(+)